MIFIKCSHYLSRDRTSNNNAPQHTAVVPRSSDSIDNSFTPVSFHLVDSWSTSHPRRTQRPRSVPAPRHNSRQRDRNKRPHPRSIPRLSFPLAAVFRLRFKYRPRYRNTAASIDHCFQLFVDGTGASRMVAINNRGYIFAPRALLPTSSSGERSTAHSLSVRAWLRRGTYCRMFLPFFRASDACAPISLRAQLIVTVLRVNPGTATPEGSFGVPRLRMLGGVMWVRFDHFRRFTFIRFPRTAPARFAVLLLFPIETVSQFSVY